MEKIIIKSKLQLILFCIPVLLALCNKQPVSATRVILLNPDGLISKNGDTITNSPLLVLNSEITDDSTWYNVLLPNRTTACIKLDSSNLQNVIIENDTIEAFAVNPDDEQFIDYIDSTFIFTKPFMISGSPKNRRSINLDELRIWDENHYYPFLTIHDNDAVGYIQAGLLRLSYHGSMNSAKHDFLDDIVYYGLIFPPFINHITDSVAMIAFASVSASFVYNGSSLIKDSFDCPLKDLDCIINQKESSGLSLKSIYSVNKNSVMLLCYSDGTVVRVRFEEDYPFHIKGYKPADLDGNGLYEYILELRYLYGDGFYDDLLIFPDTFIPGSFYISKFNYDGMSGEGEEGAYENGNREWFVKRTDKIDRIVIKEKHKNGSISEEPADIGKKCIVK